MPIKDNVSQATNVARWRANQEMRMMKVNKRIGELQSQLDKHKLALAEEALKAEAGLLPAKSAGLRAEIEGLEVKAQELRAQHEKLAQEEPPQADEHSTRGKLAHAASVVKWKAQQGIMQQIVQDKTRDAERHILDHKQALGTALVEEWGPDLDATPALHEAYTPITATEAEIAEQRQLHEQIKAEPPPAAPVATEGATAGEAPASLPAAVAAEAATTGEASAAPVADDVPAAPPAGEAPVTSEPPAAPVADEAPAEPPAGEAPKPE